jgi:hypothetical protein
MALRQTAAPLDLTGRALLLGELGDVALIDLTGPDGAGELEPPTPADTPPHPDGKPVGARVASAAAVELVVAAGAALIVVPRVLAASPAVVAASAAGIVVVVSGSAERAGAAALELLGSGGTAGRVVVEVPVAPHTAPLHADDVAQLAELGLLAGVSFPPLPALTDEALGWEIGTITRLLVAGVRTFRGVDPERFSRVRAVHEATEAARAEGAAS